MRENAEKHSGKHASGELLAVQAAGQAVMPGGFTIDADRRVSSAFPCRSCKRDLCGLAVLEACVGCGLSVAATLAQAVERTDEADRVAIEIPCTGCSYNLRALLVDGRCPECDQPVATSVLTNSLHFAPIPWLALIRSGVTSLFTALACLLASVTCFFLLRGGLPPLPSDVAVLIFCLLVVLVLVAAVALSTGLFWISTREPSFGREAQRCTRLCVRSAVLILLPLVFGLVLFRSNALILASRAFWIELLASAIAIFVPIAVLALLRQFLLRTPGRMAALATRALVWFFLTLGLACLLLRIGWYALPLFEPDPRLSPSHPAWKTHMGRLDSLATFRDALLVGGSLAAVGTLIVLALTRHKLIGAMSASQRMTPKCE